MCIGRKLAVLKMLSICQKYFFCKLSLHAHLQYVCNIPAKNQMDIHVLKGLGGIDFTKYALSPMSQYIQWSKIG